MKKDMSILLCFLSFLIPKAISQNISSNYTIVWETNRYDTIYAYVDSLNSTVKPVVLKDQIITKSAPSFVVISKEFGLGTLMGVGLSLPCGIIASKISGEKGWGGITTGAVGLTGGFLVGYSYGVFLMAKSENRNVSFLGTLASGIIGTGIGIGINIATNHHGIGRWTPIILPLSLPILYAELWK